MFDLIRGRQPSAAAVLCAFDLLALDGEDLRREPIETRKSTLKSLLRGKHAGIAFNAHFIADGAIVYRQLGARLRGHCLEAAGIPVSLGPRRLLAEGKEPGGARGHARGRGGVELRSIMSALDRSRPARMALALFGLVGAVLRGRSSGSTSGSRLAKSAFAMAFALALLLEIAGGWQETTRRSRRRLLQAFSFVLGVIILAVVMYCEGWEAVLFVLIFLAIWQLATIEPAGDF